jgi:hypothetical protein
MVKLNFMARRLTESIAEAAAEVGMFGNQEIGVLF